MTESLQFYIALYAAAAPAILSFAVIVLALLMMPVYLIDTRKD